MRIAYIGLSTPIFYDYSNPAPRTRSDDFSSPNPVLDSPFGLMLLYDELWFLCPSLCPSNMRDLPFVRFLDRDPARPQISDIYPGDIGAELGNANMTERQDRLRASFESYWDTVKAVGVHWKANPDNHTHDLTIGDLHTSANSLNPRSIAFDLEFLHRLNRPDVELITNSFTQRWFESPDNPVIRTRLAELLIIDNIPNYQQPQGPYHPCIEEVRGDPYLVHFREWITRQPQAIEAAEAIEIKREVSATIQRAQDELFLKYLDPRQGFFSMSKTIAEMAADALIPGISAVTTLAEEVNRYFDARDRRWQGFIVSTRRLPV